jgi:hypothetical protein
VTGIAAACNTQQRRTVGGRRLLGPDAVGAAVDAFGRLGAEVVVRPSPWQLGVGQETLPVDLTRAWLAGWLAAAREQIPDLAAATA